MPTNQLQRLQHPRFGKEIRALLRSNMASERQLAGAVAEELDQLTRLKAKGMAHSKEHNLEDDLRDVGYLKWKPPGFSVRAYFTVQEGTVFMLHLDANKRRTDLADSTKRLLKERLRDVKESLKENAS